GWSGLENPPRPAPGDGGPRRHQDADPPPAPAPDLPGSVRILESETVRLRNRIGAARREPHRARSGGDCGARHPIPRGRRATPGGRIRVPVPPRAERGTAATRVDRRGPRPPT